MSKSIDKKIKKPVVKTGGSIASSKLVEKALRESEEKYRTLTENIGLGIFRSTPGPKGKFLEVNSAFAKMLGYKNKKKLFETDVAQIYQNPKDRIKFIKKISRKSSVKNEELCLKKKDGTPIIVSATAIAVRNKNGKILYFDGIVEDITQRKKAGEELLIQKTYLEKLYNSAPEAIVLHDNDDLIADVNAEFTRMFGYSRKEAIGKPINELLASEDFKDEATLISEKVIRGEKIDFDSKRKRKDGTLIDVWILGAPIIHEGKQIGDYAIYRDITERKKAEEELLLQKTYFEKLFNSAPEAITLQDNNDFIVNVNDDFTKLFGYSRQEAIGKTINELVAPKELWDEAVKVSKMVKSGERVEIDTKRKRKSGSLFDVSILVAPIVHEGKPVGDYAIYRDITERKKAEEELYLQKTYLEKLFNSAPEAIVWHDNNDIVVNVNDEFTSLFGYSREEAIGRSINDLVAPEELLDEASKFSNSVINGERVEADSIRKRKDGTRFDVSILGAPIIHEGKQISVYAIYRDITERNKAREVRIRLKEEARMARNIQANLFPKSNPKISGYDIAGMSLPALNVGGDYYDFIQLDEHRLAICLGDVSGKGLAAALVMSNLQATIRGQSFLGGTSNECLERANKLLFDSTDSKTFVSLFYGILDTNENSLCYANAGQNTPFLFSESKKPRPLKTHGLALGLKKDVAYQNDEIPINTGDRLLIYSDGISEAMNKNMEEFGEEKLQEILQYDNDVSASKSIERIIEAVNLHFGSTQQNDDMTLIILRRKS